MLKINWKDADWTKPNTEIAKSLQCSYKAVQLHRKKLGICPVAVSGSGKPGRPIGITQSTQRLISNINWNRRNIDIAKIYKLSPSRIHQLRIERAYQSYLKWQPITPAIEVVPKSEPKSLWNKICNIIGWTWSD